MTVYYESVAHSAKITENFTVSFTNLLSFLPSFELIVWFYSTFSVCLSYIHLINSHVDGWFQQKSSNKCNIPDLPSTKLQTNKATSW